MKVRATGSPNMTSPMRGLAITVNAAIRPGSNSPDVSQATVGAEYGSTYLRVEVVEEPLQQI